MASRCVRNTERAGSATEFSGCGVATDRASEAGLASSVWGGRPVSGGKNFKCTRRHCGHRLRVSDRARLLFAQDAKAGFAPSDLLWATHPWGGGRVAAVAVPIGGGKSAGPHTPREMRLRISARIDAGFRWHALRRLCNRVQCRRFGPRDEGRREHQIVAPSYYSRSFPFRLWASQIGRRDRQEERRARPRSLSPM